MRNLLRKCNKIVVNTDIDGVLSAYVLCKYCGCEIVGFSNSRDCVWWREDKMRDVFDAVYLDMYVAHPKVLTIDQHIIAHDAAMAAQLDEFGTKLNPNIENVRTFMPNESYARKYPFGTVHYILAKLGQMGVEVHLDLDKVISSDFDASLTVGDFFLRADDAFKTTLASSYRANAKEWWSWLRTLSGETCNICDLHTYLSSFPARPRKSIERLVDDKKESIKRYFKMRFGGKADGGFSQACGDDGAVNANVAAYMTHFFASILDAKDTTLLKDALSARYRCQKGTAHRIMITAAQADELRTTGTIDGQNVFSYAYIAAWRGPTFSYTVMD